MAKSTDKTTEKQKTTAVPDEDKSDAGKIGAEQANAREAGASEQPDAKEPELDLAAGFEALAEAGARITVTCRAQAGRRRAGRRWSGTVTIPVTELDATGFGKVMADPALIVALAEPEADA